MSAPTKPTEPTEAPFVLGDVAAAAADYAARTAELERHLETLRTLGDARRDYFDADSKAEFDALCSARIALADKIHERKMFHAQWAPFVRNLDESGDADQ